MYVQTFASHPALRPFVYFYWYLELDGSEPQPQRLLPGIRCDLIIQIGSPAKYRIDKSGWKVRRATGFLEGHFKKYFLLKFPHKCCLAGIRFAAAGLYPFVKIPVKEFTNRFIDLGHVFGRSGLELIEEVTTMSTMTELPAIFDRFLMQRLENTVEINPVVGRAVELVKLKRGIISVHELLESVSINERQLERVFERHIGMSAECLAKILRLQRFINLSRKPGRPSFAGLAYECGFTDQSHLIRLFKQHTGLTPRDYFIKQHDIQEKLNRDGEL